MRLALLAGAVIGILAISSLASADPCPIENPLDFTAAEADGSFSEYESMINVPDAIQSHIYEAEYNIDANVPRSADEIYIEYEYAKRPSLVLSGRAIGIRGSPFSGKLQFRQGTPEFAILDQMFNEGGDIRVTLRILGAAEEGAVAVGTWNTLQIPVPEPSGLLLMTAGLSVAGGWIRSSRRPRQRAG